MDKIMIVDDNKDFLKEISETLFLCGYNPKTVSDSATAFKVARKIKPSVVLLDLKMERKNGFQVAEELRHSSETAEIPIIAMSGYFPVEKNSLLDLSNMNIRIKKPFAIADLISQIESLMPDKGNI